MSSEDNSINCHAVLLPLPSVLSFKVELPPLNAKIKIEANKQTKQEVDTHTQNNINSKFQYDSLPTPHAVILLILKLHVHVNRHAFLNYHNIT